MTAPATTPAVAPATTHASAHASAQASPRVIAVRLKRAYEAPVPEDGYRALVDALWPRGVTKDALKAVWHKEVAPSADLRRAFHHDAERWGEFRRAYLAELAEPERRAALDALLAEAGSGPLTLVYGARDTEHNNAVVLHEALTRRR